MFDVASLNPLAIAVAAVVSAALGAAWYSPLLFGPRWMAELGKTQDQLGYRALYLVLMGAICGGWRG